MSHARKRGPVDNDNIRRSGSPLFVPLIAEVASVALKFQGSRITKRYRRAAMVFSVQASANRDLNVGQCSSTSCYTYIKISRNKIVFY